MKVLEKVDMQAGIEKMFEDVGRHPVKQAQKLPIIQGTILPS